MGGVLALAEKAWRGELDLRAEFHPLRPLELPGEEIAPGVWWRKGTASATVVETAAGLVALDAGKVEEGPAIHADVRRWRPEAPLTAAVFSHHHIDHIGGLGPFEAEAASTPVVYGHEQIAPNLERYVRTRKLNAGIRVRQSGATADRGWPEEYRRPDVTHREGMTVAVGDITLELRAARGETDDHTWTWIPERGIVHAGDLFIWALPNAGNPQKVQRYAGAWATALQAMAACHAEVLIPGHGMPIVGEARIRQALTDTAELLSELERQTLTLMNQGACLADVVECVVAPAHLLERPYLQPIYDHPQFVVRNIWRQFGGWYDGEADHLLPAPRGAEAAEWMRLAGGVEQVVNRARQLCQQGELALASHLVEEAVIAEPSNSRVHRVRSEIYAARAAEEPAMIARHLFAHAAASSRLGCRDSVSAED